MNDKLNQYLNGIFAPYDGLKSVAELRDDLLSDLQERFRELKAEGKDDDRSLTIRRTSRRPFRPRTQRPEPSLDACGTT